MDKKSLEKIKKIFKSLNDKLAKIEDPALYGRKRTAKYNVVDRQIDNVISNDNAVNNALNDINEKLDEHDEQLNKQATKLIELEGIVTNNETEVQPLLPNELPVEEIVPKEDEKVQSVKPTEIQNVKSEIQPAQPVKPTETQNVKSEIQPAQPVEIKSNEIASNKKQVDNKVENQKLSAINLKLKQHDNILEDHADKIDELQNSKNEIVSVKDDATKIEPPADPTEEQLKATNLRYNEKTQRFHENEGERKNAIVSKADALNRVEEHRSKNATAERSDENNIFEEIYSNLIKINESLSSILSLLSDQKPVESDGKVEKRNQPAQLGAEEEKPKGGMGGLAGIVAFTLFAIFPTVLAWIKEKLEKISEFLMPVFDFIFESVIPFFTEKLPKFFMEDIPEYFSEKFDVVKDFASDFMGDIKKVIAGIQKTVGETIVKLAGALPDWDWLKSTKDALLQYGGDMVSSADTTIKDVDKEQAKTQAKREEKKKRDILLKQADDEGKRVVELNKAKGYKGYEVKPDFEKGLVKIECKVDGTDGVSQVDQFFDANKSKESGTLIEKTGGSPRPVKGDNGGTPVKGGEGQSDAASSGGTPEPTVSSGGQGETGAPVGGQAEGGTATPELNQTTADKGNALDTNSKDNENPPAKSKSSAPPVVSIPSTGQKVRMLPGQGPHDINDVPDPTPFLGDMANQLFYRSA